MRKIKFRGKPLNIYKFEEQFVYGNLIINCNNKVFININGISCNGTEINSTFEVYPKIVEKFTGFYLRGRELYEGDIIVNSVNDIGYIIMHNGEWCIK